MILAQGARGPGFNSRSSPYFCWKRNMEAARHGVGDRAWSVNITQKNQARPQARTLCGLLPLCSQAHLSAPLLRAGREKRAAPGSLHRGMNCSTHACWQTLSAKRCHRCTADAPIKLSGQGPSPCGRGLELRVREAPGAVPRAASILVAGNVEAVLHGDGDPRAWVVSLRPERYIQVSLAPAGEKPGPCWGSSPGRRVRSNLRSSQNHLWGEAAPSTGGLREG